MELRLFKKIKFFIVIVHPVLFVIFCLLYLINRTLYLNLTYEDNVIEWLTFVLFFLSALLSLLIFRKIKRERGYYHYFYILFSLLCIFSAMEEISWGQRVLNIRSPNFFLLHSDQQEINIHNVFQEATSLKTKHVAGITMLFYGIVFPLISTWNPVKNFFKKIKLIIPPKILIVAFSLGFILAFDLPTGQEEELSEFFFSLCFLMFMIIDYLKHYRRSEI